MHLSVPAPRLVSGGGLFSLGLSRPEPTAIPFLEDFELFSWRCEIPVRGNLTAGEWVGGGGQ